MTKGRNDPRFRANNEGFEAEFHGRSGPGQKILIDIDELITDNDLVDLDDDSFFSDDGDDNSDDINNLPNDAFFQKPDDGLMKDDVTNIPGSPWAKPPVKHSNRPKEPLPIAKFASTVAFGITLLWVAALFVMSIWNYSSVGRIIVECLLSFFAFFGLFWNTYFTVSSIFKCFIPLQAYRQNTKYCSIVPEKKHPGDNWLDVTIQIPVYKESLKDVLMPTLKSCMTARDYYIDNSHAKCNIVICDDGIMAFLKDNFPAAEMLWESIVDTEGKVLKLGQLLKRVPRPSRRHLKGLRSKSIYEVFHRMLFYYHYNIGFVARSTIDRRGKFKKASNLNSHLRLVFAAGQLVEKEKISFDEALLEVSHDSCGSREIMFGNDIAIGALICVNDADARMSAPVILKTVPEFLNDHSLGFTQHATKTMDDQRGESYYLNMIATYTDSLYQGHFLLSSILGCHPPLVGHSIFLRSEAVKQCGRMRTLRKAQRWLNNVGLPFLSVDQVGFGNLQKALHTEYWSECHVSEDFELMIHLYNLGYNGRYVAYPDCEFQEGVTRTFDEEAGRHRKFSLGAHELIFNPFQDMVGHGIFTPLFKTFLTCDIPSYYKIFLTAYLFGYTSGGIYIVVFTAAAVTRILDTGFGTATLYAFSPAAILVLNIVIYYVIGYSAFLISMLRMHFANKNIFFPIYRKCNKILLVWKHVRYGMLFQILFYSAMGNYFFLGSMDHLLSRNGVVSATNKDLISAGRCSSLWEVVRFNTGSWMIALALVWISYAVYLSTKDWDYTAIPEVSDLYDPHGILFAGPTVIVALVSFIVPIILNPYVLGWPFVRQKKVKKTDKKSNNGKQNSQKKGYPVAIDQYIATTNKLDKVIQRSEEKPDIELGSLDTPNMGSQNPFSVGQTTNYTSDRDLGSANHWRLGGEFAKNPNAPNNYTIPDSYKAGGRQQVGSKLQDRTNAQSNRSKSVKFDRADV